jgi:hypothetical protein
MRAGAGKGAHRTGLDQAGGARDRLLGQSRAAKCSASCRDDIWRHASAAADTFVHNSSSQAGFARLAKDTAAALAVRTDIVTGAGRTYRGIVARLLISWAWLADAFRR